MIKINLDIPETIEEWGKKLDIHKKILNQLNQVGITVIYPHKHSYHSHDKFSRWYGAENRLLNSTDTSSFVHLFLIRNITKESFMELLGQVLETVHEKQDAYVLLDGNKKYYFDYFPEHVKIIHKYRTNIITPLEKTYPKKNMYNKLKEILDNIPNLPIPPKAIYGYGSFFREKEIIGDIDISIEYDYENPRWKKFLSFFTWDDDDPDKERKIENYNKLRDIVFEERQLEYKKRNRLIRFKKKCQEKEFQKKLKDLDIDIELLQYCTWSQLCGDKDFYYGFYFRPSLEEVFNKSFKMKKEGISISFLDRIDRGQNYILLWSKKNTDFEYNYQNWYKNEKDSYIRKEYFHLLNEIDKWIKNYKDEKRYIDSEITDQLKNADIEAIKKFNRLKSKFPSSFDPEETYSSISELVNVLRDMMKDISLEEEKSKKKIRFFYEFNNSVWGKKFT